MKNPTSDFSEGNGAWERSVQSEVPRMIHTKIYTSPTMIQPLPIPPIRPPLMHKTREGGVFVPECRSRRTLPFATALAFSRASFPRVPLPMPFDPTTSLMCASGLW